MNYYNDDEIQASYDRIGRPGFDGGLDEILEDQIRTADGVRRMTEQLNDWLLRAAEAGLEVSMMQSVEDQRGDRTPPLNAPRLILEARITREL